MYRIKAVILIMLQFIWIAVPYLLKFSDKWCSGDALSSAHSCGWMCCRKWFQWDMDGASQHLFCFPHIIILVYCCSVIFDYMKLFRINRIDCCNSSQACFFLLGEISNKVNYQRVFMLTGCWKLLHHFFCLDGTSVSPCFRLTDVTGETPESLCAISIF